MYDSLLNGLSGIPLLRLSHPVLNDDHTSLLTIHPVEDRRFSRHSQLVKIDFRENGQHVKTVLTKGKMTIHEIVDWDKKRDIV